METAPYFTFLQPPLVVGHCEHKLGDNLRVTLISHLCGAYDYCNLPTKQIICYIREKIGRGGKDFLH